MLSSDQVHNYVNEYAPIIFFNSNEKYFLTSAEQYISICNEAETDYGPGLTLKNRDDQSLEGDMNDTKTYVNVKMYPDQGYVDIQYWFLYAFNGPGTIYIKHLAPGSLGLHGVKLPHFESDGDYVITPCGQHEGDWEHVTARVDLSDGTLQQIYYAQHKAGVWLDGYPQPGNFPNRVVFYSSKFGHAAYPDMGRNYTEVHKEEVVEFRLVNDTQNPDAEMDMRGRCQIIGIQSNGTDVSAQYSDYEKPNWMMYTGEWGEVLKQRPPESVLEAPIVDLPLLKKFTLKYVMQKLGIYDQCEQETGPLPPWSKTSWQSDENTE